MSLGSYLGAVRNAVQSENGPQLRNLLRLDSDAAFVVMQLSQRGSNVPVGEVQRQLPAPWGDIIASYLQTLLYLSKGERLAAVKEFRERHCKGMLDVLGKDAWVVSPVIGMAVTLKALSEQADEEQTRKGATGTQLSSCSMLLQTVFRNTAASKGADNATKRAAAVAIACVMMKVYFRLNTINNCKNVISTIDNVLKIFDSAQAAHRVTFRYYTGRLAAYDEDFQKAEEHLQYAFQNCHQEAHENKRKILRYLIPVRMLLGVLPSDALLQQHQLLEYQDIKAAVRSGDVALLQRCLDQHQAQFVQAGTYLLLEKLQLAVYRRLFKRCALLNAELNPAKATQVPLAYFQCALKLQGLEKDNAELQCILANLIYRKYIKGYIAYKSRVVVLAKTDAFPDLSTVQLGDPFAL